MRFSPSFLDEIKARVSVSEVVRSHVRLTKAGREWRGLSPFTQEKTPSFFVNDLKQGWFDFSSGQNGNIFDFLMKKEGLTFPEAVEKLAQRAGLPLPADSKGEGHTSFSSHALLYKALNLAASFFQSHLKSRQGAKARAYLNERGVSVETQQHFGLGYALEEKQALYTFLRSQDLSAETLIQAGLIVQNEDHRTPFDRFRDRLMFPITDRQGRLIAFGGRSLNAQTPAKYLNSPETPLFHKSQLLYNYHKARQTAHERKTFIVVEGYMDVIALTSAGFPHTVAPLGTALSPDQCRILWETVEDPILCFDGDPAGRKAAYRAMDLALPLINSDKSLRFVFLPPGQDPDDIIRAGQVSVLKDLLDQALPLMDALWLRESQHQPLDRPERWARLEKRCQALTQTITEPTLRNYYSTSFRERLYRLRTSVFFPSKKGTPTPPRSSSPSVRSYEGRKGLSSSLSSGYVSRPPEISTGLHQTPLFPQSMRISPGEVQIFFFLLHFPSLILHYAESLAGLEIDHQDLAKFRDFLISSVQHSSTSPTAVDLVQMIALSPFKAVHQTLEAESAFLRTKISQLEPSYEELFLQALTFHEKVKALRKELEEIEKDLAQEMTEVNWQRFEQVRHELRALENYDKKGSI